MTTCSYSTDTWKDSKAMRSSETLTWLLIAGTNLQKHSHRSPGQDAGHLGCKSAKLRAALTYSNRHLFPNPTQESRLSSS